MKLILGLLLLISLSSSAFARVPPRNHETEEIVDNAKPKDENPVERTPVSSSSPTNDENPSAIDKNRKPIGVILFRQQPAFSLFRDRSPFSPALGHPHFAFSNGFGNSNGFNHDDPAIRLISLLFGDRRMRPMGPMMPDASSETENTSGESSGESGESERRDVNPFEAIFPDIFVRPKFPMDTEREGEATTNGDDKKPVNFENKERKVINIGDKKFVKVTQTKKVKNDFGEFHSVISSYEPFDEKKHDENGNEKINPDGESVNKKKDVEPSSTPMPPKATTESENNNQDNKHPSSTTLSTTSSTTEASVEKEDDKDEDKEESKPELDIQPNEDKKPEPLNKIDDAKNEIPDKNAEIKVDQMN